MLELLRPEAKRPRGGPLKDWATAALVTALALAGSPGCGDSAPQAQDPWSYAPAADTPPGAAAAIARELEPRFGTPRLPEAPVVGGGGAERARHGARRYQQLCLHCHGTEGRGDGPAAAFLSRAVPDFGRGIFKYKSTRPGSAPLRSDLLRTVRTGLPGSPMPAFSGHPSEDVEAVVDYLIVLATRAESERALIPLFRLGANVPADAVVNALDSVAERWRDAERHVSLASLPSLERPAADRSIERGRALFTEKGCVVCHGADGSGRDAAPLFDAAGHRIVLPDFTVGRTRSGMNASSLLRTITNGIEGSPMVSFATALGDEDMADLVRYLLNLDRTARRERRE